MLMINKQSQTNILSLVLGKDKLEGTSTRGYYWHCDTIVAEIEKSIKFFSARIPLGGFF